jgi:hypothetical protein
MSGRVFGVKMPDPMREAMEAEAEGLGLTASSFTRIALLTLIDQVHQGREDPQFYKSLTMRAAKARAS